MNVETTTDRSSPFPSRQSLVVFLFLTVIILAVYWQVGHHAFVNYDDNWYITENEQVREGLTFEGIQWAFTTFHASNWHPLTWLSHMLDCEIYGLKPRGHHLTNVFLHLANTLLLFGLLQRMTGALWRSAFVATLFAIHPLHVESVAWAAERKDVLSTLFWMLTLWAYVRYAESPRISRYLPVFLLFALGLMAKPMVVTLPFVLFLLDFWPLKRFHLEQHSKAAPSRSGKGGSKKKARRPHSGERPFPGSGTPFYWLALEKIPLLFLVATASVMTMLAQRWGGGLISEERLPAGIRIANALAAYMRYIWKMLFPMNLSVLYPHPGAGLPVWKAAGAGFLLVLITFYVLCEVRRRPYLAVGWFWYVGTLVPVIGFVQVGIQSMADRYTYIPLIGLFLIIAWGVAELLANWPTRKAVLALFAGLLISIFMAASWLRAGTWRSSLTLWGDKVREYKTSLERNPNLNNVRFDLAQLYFTMGRIEEARKEVLTVLEKNPRILPAYLLLGSIYLAEKEYDRAEEEFALVIKMAPASPAGYYDAACLESIRGNRDLALEYLGKALRYGDELYKKRARQDKDFDNICRDVRFLEMVR